MRSGFQLRPGSHLLEQMYTARKMAGCTINLDTWNKLESDYQKLMKNLQETGPIMYVINNNPNMNQVQQTKGESRVRVSFNPSDDTAVSVIKQKTAELINEVDALSHSTHPEFLRLKALAMTDFESAAMWAVKAATFKED